MLSGTPTLRRGATTRSSSRRATSSSARAGSRACTRSRTRPTSRRGSSRCRPRRVPEVVVYPELDKVFVVTRDPFETPAEGDDPGIVASFDWPPPEK